MSPIKRTRRAADKQQAGRGRHARPAVRSAEVPPELASQDYEFPHVQLPASRPLVTSGELLAALEADDTQPIDLTYMVVDDTPQPAHAEGLVPAPVPSLPFLNAGAAIPDTEGVLDDLRLPGPDPVLAARTRARTDQMYREDPNPAEEPTGVIVRVGNALPAALSAAELMLFGRPIPLDAPPAVQPEARPQLPLPVRRSREHALVFASFDDGFWQQIDRTVAEAHGAEPDRAMAYDERERELAERVVRLEAAHRGFVARMAAQEYAGQLAERIRPLPQRVPGAALDALDAEWLVSM